jgi:hypothetical protein
MTVGVERDRTVQHEETGSRVISGSGCGGARDAAEAPKAPITVEQAYQAKLRAAAADAAVATPSAQEAVPDAVPQPASPVLAAARPPLGSAPAGPGRQPESPHSNKAPGVQEQAVVLEAAPPRRARPRIEPEQGILGLSRHSRSRLGSRLFNLFFVCVFALILVQMVVALLAP